MMQKQLSMTLAMGLLRLMPRRCLAKSVLKSAKVVSFLSRFFEECVVFKLLGDDHAQALALDGAHLFDPSGKGRAMKEWVQVPHMHVAHWPRFEDASHRYVSTL